MRFKSKWQNPCQVVQRAFFVAGTTCKGTGRAEGANRDGKATHQEAPTTCRAVTKPLDSGLRSKSQNNEGDSATLGDAP